MYMYNKTVDKWKTQFTIAKLWKQPRCPSKDEWIKKLWYMYTMEYYSALKRIKLWHLQINGWNPVFK
uniref:Uncharacterized protein n=1 Tax=Spermophilus dauricus TaxID=99837 RepID=A0A8C9PA63_SPEDA